MEMDRWTSVTESSWEHEHRGLEAIRRALPDTEPWYAFSNFTFTERWGHVREVDLLVIAPNGVHMIELKDWRGLLTVQNGDWVVRADGKGRRHHRSPLHLNEQKAKELAALLAPHLGAERVFVTSHVCLTNKDLTFDLPPGDRANTHTIAELVRVLNGPVLDERRRVTPQRAKSVARALQKVGIGRSEADFTVGAYQLEHKPFDIGPTWSDYQAKHADLGTLARVRIYVSERGADAETRKSVYDSAKREAAVLRQFRHPGVVRFVDIDSGAHPAGPALIFEYDPATIRLDEFVSHHADTLDLADRLQLIRQLAETVRAAHSRHIYHRGLAAHSVHVVPRLRDRHGRRLGEQERWRTANLLIADWQIATQHSTVSRPGLLSRTRTSLTTTHLAPGTEVYLAPELTAPNPKPIEMDVYGLGMLAYLLLAGRPPAATQAELLAGFEAGEGLRPGAVVDGLHPYIDELIEAATAFQPERRISTVDEFLEWLELIETELRAPAEPEPVAPEVDPLEAVAGDILDRRWEVRRRLGTGSTSRAFLVRDLECDPRARDIRAFAVLKVALSDSRADALAREADVMRRLRKDARIIQLVDPGLIRIGNRACLLLEYVGDERELAEPTETTGKRRRTEETVARHLRENGRLTVDELEAYGEYLFGAVEFLEGEGIWHRDLKPDNVAIRVRPNRTRQLVLIDFSLAGYPAKDTEAGTDGYLDPFIGTVSRTNYDAHAERYALAATLHEMASAELPRWGDGSVAPRQTDPKQLPYPEIAADAFDPSIRDGLIAFFRKALHRDAAQRFDDLKPMRDEWRRIFLEMARAVPSRPRTRQPVVDAAESADFETHAGGGYLAPADAETSSQERDRIAEQATRETPLATAGLTAAAEQFLYGLGINTVGDLLDYSQRNLINAPGLGARTRIEIQGRQKQWGRLLGRTAPNPLTAEGRRDAKEELGEAQSAAADLGQTVLRALSLDALVSQLVPELNNNGSNAKKIAMVTRLLQVPGVEDLPDLGVWPTQSAVAASMGVTSPAISQSLKQMRQRWRKSDALSAVRDELVELLGEFGRVASVVELADALIVRRGTRLDGRAQRRALAVAVLRAVVEAEQLTPDEAAFECNSPRDGALPVVLALEVDEANDPPETPSVKALLGYAARLGAAADRLADSATLPTPGTVLERLSAIDVPPGVVAWSDLGWDERRLVQLAVGASRNAAATPRLEIYPLTLPLVRAARLTQAGLIRLIPGLERRRQPGIRVAEVHERIRTRFPELGAGQGLPEGSELTVALRNAGFDLVLETSAEGIVRYLPTHGIDAFSSLSVWSGRRSTATTVRDGRWADDPTVRAAALAEEQLTAAAGRDGFRVLTVRSSIANLAANEIANRFAAEQISITGLFLSVLHDLVPAGGKPTWETILRADAADPGSKGATRFAEFAQTAFGRIQPEVLTRLAAAPGPVLMVDTFAFARYNAIGVLNRLADQARHSGHGLWMLCPQDDPDREPRLGTVAVPFQAGFSEWIVLTDDWIRNTHRSGIRNINGDNTGVSA
ncbi:BREX system serine/threonine kinase PglW [Nocardia blacklockiae]|uniref:BREX system serine/threonine kinase PglW n=1 Tax=Nocardia blacklockiae TaxID=480036 RepID=UPI0018940401|nr:BREX system serine/threonine kinase PglW [Nocardia blacklockiae]MBF6175295.1 BREX system serine/threonine kinase PglW [Nocardia blacklockiae]